MNNELQVFSYEGNEVRTVQQGEETRWVLKDVCAVFGDTNYRRTAGHLDDDEKGVSRIATLGGEQEMIVVNEGGLYHALFTMAPENARGVDDEYIARRTAQLRKFKRWVTHEVLPSIRKSGSYSYTQDSYTIDDPVLRAQRWIEERRERDRLALSVEQLEPKRIFADAVSASKTSVLIGELAKILKANGLVIGQNRLFDRLRNDGYLIRRRGSDYNMPTQKAMESALFEIKETVVAHSDGHTSVSKTPKVTGKGQIYFVNKYISR